jgi:Tol biopolymer transport system component
LTDVHGYDAEGGFSPDGKKIVFCSLRDAFPLEDLTEEKREIYEKQPDYFGEIYIMDADGGNQTRLTDWPGYDGGPFFTPDGRRIVWRHFSEDGLLADIYTMKPDGSDVRRLTDFAAMSWAPFFHPSGEYVIFVSNKLGFDNFELFLVDGVGKHEPVQVTYTERFDGLPTFSPDGKTIVWTSNNTDNGMSQLFMGTWDHEAALAALAKSPLRETEAKP